MRVQVLQGDEEQMESIRIKNNGVKKRYVPLKSMFTITFVIRSVCSRQYKKIGRLFPLFLYNVYGSWAAAMFRGEDIDPANDPKKIEIK